MPVWRAHLLAVAVPLSVVVAAGCTGSSGTTARPAPATATPARAVANCYPDSCVSPQLFRVAYGIQPLLDRGIDGRGETVTVLAPAPPPGTPAPSTPVPDSSPPPGAGATDVRQDLAAFDGEFRLPAAPIQVVNTLAGAASPWQAAVEEAQDVEIVHAVAPAATLRVVLLPSNVLDRAATATAGLLAGLRLAVSGTDVALVGWSLGEHFFTKAQAAQMQSILAEADAHHVTVVAGSGDDGGFSSGDNGAYSATSFGGTPVEEVSLPAADPLVLAVGGTMLTVSPVTGAYISETTWNGQSGFSISGGASGGGFSHLYARPAYQDGVPGISAMRGVPDVAGDAYDEGGVSIVTVSGGKTGIAPASGTGAAASLWAGLMALADQDAGHDLGFVNPAIYRIARSSGYHQAFHDVTTGSNILTMPYPGGTAGWQAGPGWDPATGWGTPDAQALVPLLAA